MKTEKRHFKSWGGQDASRSDQKRLPTRIKLLLVLLWLVLMGGLSHSVVAQTTCTLTCNAPTEEAPLQLALGANCEALITTDVVLEAQELCPGDKRMVVRDSDGNIIIEDENEVLADFSEYVNQVINVTVIDEETGIFCTSFIEIVDNQAPVINCVDQVISCTADTSVTVIGRPEISDNCDANLEVRYSDVVDPTDCASSGTLTVTRTWIAEDGSGLVSSCTQSIVLERPDLLDIDFPPNVILPCEEPFASPDSTGYPTIDGVRVQTSSPCDLVITYQDDTTFTCNKVAMTIVRNWIALRRCDGATRIGDQIIEIKDDTPPMITCPEDFVVDNSAGDCSATIMLPSAIVTDNCDGDATFFVESSFGMGLGPFFEVPEGRHIITYTAIDACLNRTQCQTQLDVIDSEIPTAICDDEVTVSLTDGGVAIARALSFDEGSRDNCVDQLFYKILRMDTATCDSLNGDDNLMEEGYQEWFDDFVFFCCEDMMNDSLLVRLRVFTVDPGQGPVDPARMGADGDLVRSYNECMTRVVIEDKIAPELTCPPPDTIDCREPLFNLGRFGSPIVQEGCSFTLDSTSVIDRDNCGTGMIFRTFTVTDNSGNSASCTQTINIESQLLLVDTMITWPMDVDTNLCGGTLLPSMLPDSLAEPIVDYEACSIIGMSYTDTRFDISYPACYKILRRWSVIDWCQFDESGEGRFNYTQTIKVQDEEAPIITCIENVEVSTNGGSCNTANVILGGVTATDNCSPNIRIINDSEFATNPRSPDASGVYPLGTTTVTYTASDHCGNVSRCSVDITVVDRKAPAPVCVEGLVATLSEGENGEILAAIQANIFIVDRTFDECHPKEEITLSMRRAIEDPQGPPTDTTSLIFACDDVGIQDIEIWVTDPQGNSDYCVTSIDIQDNNSICPVGAAMGFIAGNIQTERGKKVEEVSVSLQNSNPFATFTDVQGGFMIDGIPYGEDFTVIPKKEDDLLNGVSTIDMIIISKHILGVKPITSPYSLIAADIDASGNISTLDLIRLRKLILNATLEFPNGNTSWRFIDEDFEFPDGVDPLKVNFPELKNVDDFNSAAANVGFVAIKIGDVNASVRPNRILQSEGRTTNGDVVIKAVDQDFQPGETFTVELYSEDLFNLIGFQFTLDFNENLVELVNIEAGDLPNMSDENFGLIDPDLGIITASWNDPSILTIDKGTVCKLTFRAIRKGETFDAIRIESLPTLAEAYDFNEEPMQVLLQFIDETGLTKQSSDFQLYQNNPNPFRNQTKIAFILPKKGMAQLSIFDMAGRQVYTYQSEFVKGYNEIEVGSEIFDSHGLYYYRLEGEDFSATKKMIRSISR